MSWWTPKCRIVALEPTDPESLNLLYEEIISEVDGLLNEHNFKPAAMLNLTYVDDGACVRYAHEYSDVDPGLVDGVSRPKQSIGALVGGKATNSDQEWRTLISKQVDVDTTTLWIILSCQQLVSIIAGQVSQFESDRVGAQYAIDVDGTLLVETITGAGNRESDTLGEGFGGEGLARPVLISTIIPVQAGRHTIRARWRQTRGVETTAPANDDYWMVATRELFILEMH